MLRRLYFALPETQRQFLTFCFVGGIGFLVDSGSLYILTSLLGFDPIVGRILSMFAFGMTCTWLLNRTLTFRDQRSGSIRAEYLRFAATNIVGNLLNLGVYTVLVKNFDLFAHVPVLAIIPGTGVGLIFNFTGSKYFAYRRS